MTRLHALALGALALLVTVAPLSAHHRWPVNQNVEVTVTGTVVSYRWANPHVMMTLDVQAADGTVERWDVGGPSTIRMERNGWDRDTIEPGEVITGIGYQFVDGQKIVRLERVIRASGEVMYLYGRPS